MNAAAHTKVLVLDDEPLMLLLLTQLLLLQGITEVANCDNGAAALQLLDNPQDTPQLILCDLHMPEMDGVEFAHRLAERGFKGSLVLVSGEDEAALQPVRERIAALPIAFLGSLQKPVSPAALAALLERWTSP
jgi:CheY-like chemotaxis protein